MHYGHAILTQYMPLALIAPLKERSMLLVTKKQGASYWRVSRRISNSADETVSRPQQLRAYKNTRNMLPQTSGVERHRQAVSCDTIPLSFPLPHAKSPNPIRVVSTWYGQHAEYEVILTCGKQRWISWERFSQFSLLAAAACRENLPNSRGAWSRIVMAQPRYRCLSQEYLVEKCKLLEVVSAAKGKVVYVVQQEAQGRA